MTKLLILGTKANRVSKIESIEIIEESSSEMLTWKHHLYGDEENDGRIPILGKIIGVLKRLRKFIPDFRFKQITSGQQAMLLSQLMEWDLKHTWEL